MARPPDSVWLFLRGLARESSHWGEFPALFQSTVPHSHVVTLDLPGTGKRYLETSPTTISEIMRLVRSQWLAFNASIPGEAPRYILGLSLGGMVATEWLSQHENDFAKAILINTSQGGTSPPYERLRPSGLAVLTKTLVARTAEERERTILSITSNRPEKYEALAKSWAEIHQTRTIAFKNILNQLRAAALWKAAPTAPKTPILLLASHADRLVDPRCSQKIHDRWGCPIEWHETAGHELPLDEPQWVAERAAAWVGVSR